MDIDRGSKVYYEGNDHVNFVNWKEAIVRHLEAIDVAFDAEWFASQRKRLLMMYDAGESVSMAAEAMEAFARGNAKKKAEINALDPRVCIGIKYV